MLSQVNGRRWAAVAVAAGVLTAAGGAATVAGAAGAADAAMQAEVRKVLCCCQQGTASLAVAYPACAHSPVEL